MADNMSPDQGASIAQQKADEATNSANNAKAKEGEATTSANNAKAKETEVATSANNAKAKEGEATTSANNAKAKETEVATSANNAKAKETEAATSAKNVKTKENEATTSANNAKAKEDEATTSANNAKTKEDEATTSANNAKAKEAEATTSANNAKTKEDEATTSAKIVKAKETEATNRATSAKSQEAEATTSAKNAKTKENETIASAKNAKEQEPRIDKILQAAEEALSIGGDGAMASGLNREHDNIKILLINSESLFKKLMKLLIWLTVAIFIITIWQEFFGFGFHPIATTITTPEVLFNLMMSFLIKLPIVSPLVFYIISVRKDFNKYLLLKTFYAHRLALARSVSAIKSEISNETDKNEIIKKYFDFLTAQPPIFENKKEAKSNKKEIAWAMNLVKESLKETIDVARAVKEVASIDGLASANNFQSSDKKSSAKKSKKNK